MRQQRRLERQAQDWNERNRPVGADYLLGGTQLQEALAFLQLHRNELSDLAQDFVTTSKRIQGRLRLRPSMLLSIALIAGTASSIVSRLISPLAPTSPVKQVVQNSVEDEPSAVGDTEAEARADWERGTSEPHMSV